MAKIITSAEFDNEVLNSDIPVLVDFYATWCGPCKMIAPIIEELAAEYGENNTAKVVKLDIDQSNDIAGRYHVMSIPTLLIFKSGQVVDQIVGAVPKATIESRMQAAL